MKLHDISLQNAVLLFGLLCIHLFVISSERDADFEHPFEVGEPQGRPGIAAEDRLPICKINTNSNSIVNEPRMHAGLTIFEQGASTFNGLKGIEFRGASSLLFPKKSYLDKAGAWEAHFRGWPDLVTSVWPNFLCGTPSPTRPRS